MAKKKIRTNLDIDWMEALDGLTAEKAIEYLAKLPGCVELDSDGDYDRTYGVVFDVRYETDHEEAVRMAEESVERARLRKLAAERKKRNDERFDAKLERLKGGSDGLYRYLSKHKGNPQIGDLENLWLSLKSLQESPGSLTAQSNLTECLIELEKLTPKKFE